MNDEAAAERVLLLLSESDEDDHLTNRAHHAQSYNPEEPRYIPTKEAE